MRHRLGIEALPSFGEPEILRPATLGATSVVLLDRGFAFGGSDGVYIEERGVAERVLADDATHVFRAVRWSAKWIGVSKQRRGVPPVTEAIVFLRRGSSPIEVPGQVFGVSADGRVAVVAGRDIVRVDLSKGAAERLFPIVPVDLQEPTIAVGAGGRDVLVMEGPSPVLFLVDLETGARERLVGPIDEDAWIRAAFAPDGGIVVLDMRLGGPPLFRMLRFTRGQAPKEILTSSVCQPDGGVAFVGKAFAVAPLSLKAHPLAEYGPVDLVAVALSGGAQVPITRSGDLRGVVRTTEDAVILEGTDHVLRVAIR